MPRAEWRSPASYEHLRTLDAPGFAWEFLRRNPAFERDRKRLEEASEDGPVSAEELDGFARRWGVRFCAAKPGGGEREPLWTAARLPSVIPLIRLPSDLVDPNQCVDARFVGPATAEEGPERLIECQENVFRLHIVEPLEGQPPCVVLPLDQLFDIRANSALRLWRALKGRHPGANPATVSRARRDRLLLALRALDGRRDNASYREIAEALFGARGLSNRAWQTHDLRDRTIRLVRYGFSLMESGYLQLLLHPYRGQR
jgi:hypothetical protein